MHKILLTLPLAAALAAPVTASELPTRPGSNPEAITVSCYRGPLTDVIWDRPNAIFVDSLMRRGYSIEQAEAIGNRVCRDEYGVNDPDHMIATLTRLLAETRPARRR
jgi:hypothetical protein